MSSLKPAVLHPTMVGRKRKPIDDGGSSSFAKSRKPTVPAAAGYSKSSWVDRTNHTTTSISSSDSYAFPDSILSSSTAKSREDRRLSFGCLPRMTTVSATVPTTPLISGVVLPRTPLLPGQGRSSSTAAAAGGGPAVGASTLMKSKMLQTPASSMKTPLLSGGFNGYSWSIGKSIVKSGSDLLPPEDDENLLNMNMHDDGGMGCHIMKISSMENDPPVSPTPGNQPKHKSIAVLASSFMSLYEGSAVGTKIIVDETVNLLGTERRRIYDLFNVLDSIRLVRKVERQTYEWLGTDHLPYVLGELQAAAIAEYPVEADQFLGYDHHHDVTSFNFDNVDDFWGGVRNSNTTKNVSGQTGTKLTGKDSKNPNGKKVGKDRSMAKLSHDFLQVFLVGHDTLSLQQASDIMQGTSSPLSSRFDAAATNPVVDDAARKLNMRQQKAKIRRLYDLANIFVSVGLLQKVEAAKIPGTRANRRPDYAWMYKYTAQELRALHNQRAATKQGNKK
jgi:E2F/DP family winged-helix DNA-binding domain